ncbi:MAG: hypothetical protein IJM69_09020, partial [Firmicutes bacterium]|nr:hypothetical protein [Bacillota bacterium]
MRMKREPGIRIRHALMMLLVALAITAVGMTGMLRADGPALAASGSAALLPVPCDNLNIDLRSTSALVPTDSGYMRVFYDGDRIRIENYDNSFKLLSRKFVALELPLWGGFYAGTDSYYVVEGQLNEAESDSAEVIRVIRYSKSWQRLGAAVITGNTALFGGQVRRPFRAGCLEMTERNGYLYVATGHEGYVDESVGQGHQGLLLIEVNEQTMTGKIIACDLWHSFMQYIQADSDKLYLLEQSEGSYCTSLKRFGMSGSAEATLAVLHYGGQRTSPWAVPCYASVDDLAVSGSNVLGLGASIDQSLYDSVNQDTPHNLYLTVTPKSNFTEAATNVVWLTNYQGDGKCFLGTKITKVNDNRFLIMWEEYGSEQPATAGDPLSSSILHYLFVNGAGQKISKEYTAAAPLSDCHPVLNGTKVYWYASSGNAVNFYSIGAADGAFRKEKAYRTAGERVTWNLKGDVLTFTGEGPLTIDTETHYRYPRSSTGGGYSYSNSDNCWSPIREQVKKIVIGDGI